MENYTIEEIWDMDAGRVTCGDDDLRRLVSMALAKVPMTVADRIMEECIFIMPITAEKAAYLPEDQIRGKCLIACPESMLEEHEEAIKTLLHEVAHHYLGNGVVCPKNSPRNRRGKLTRKLRNG